MALGKLTIDLLANIAKFESDMGRAAYIAKKHATAIREEFTKIGEVFLAGLGIEKMAAFASEIAETGHALEEMSQKVGVSASDLSAFKLVADQSGLSMEQLQTGFDKFSKTATEAAGGAKLQAAEFKALGINIDDANGHIKPMRELIDETAKKFASFRDSNVKTADAMALFGKSGAELIPFLNRLGSEGFDGALAEAQKFGVYMGEDAVKASEDYRQEIIKLHEIVDGFGMMLVNVVTPALTAIIGAFTEYSTETSTATGRTQAMTDGLLDITQGFITLSSWIQKTTAWLGGFADQLGHIGELIASTPFERMAKDEATIAANPLPWKKWAAADDLKAAIADQRGNLKQFGVDVKKTWSDVDSSFSAIDADTAKKLKALWTPPNHAANDGAPIGANAPILPAVIPHVNTHALDAAKAAAQQFKEKLQELTDSLNGPAGQAQSKYDKELASFAALATKAKGNTTDMAAATAALNKQLQQMYDQLKASALGPVAREAYDYKIALRDLDDEHRVGILNATEYAKALDILADAHRKNAIAAQRELDPLGALIDDMKFETDELGRSNAQREADNFLRQQGIPLYSKEADGIRSVIEAHVALDEQMKKSIALQDSFRNDSANFFSDILSGTKSVKDAFKDLATSVLNDIARTFAQNWTEKLFGQQGQNGGGLFGGLLSKFTGGITGDNGAVAAQVTATTANTAAILGLTSTMLSSAALGSTGGLGSLGGLFSNDTSSSWLSGLFGSGKSIPNVPDFSNLSLFPGFAGGGDTPANQPFWVGEHGRELMYSRTPGTIIPNHRLADVGRSTTITQVINVQPTSTRRTAEQIANESARKLRTASARNA